MNFFRRFLLRICLRMLDASFAVDRKAIDARAVEEWAYASFDHKGLKSYFAYEDMKILKDMSFGKDNNMYHILVGRRLQLLYMFDEFRKAAENRKSEREKQQSAASGEESSSQA